MRCRKEDFIKGEYFHIYNRSISPFKLFIERDDYLWFLKKFNEKLELYPASIFAYCLMPNHFHFFLRQDSDKPIFRLFNETFSPYVRHYNFKYKRRGSLFEGALQHINIKEDRYLIYLCQYIHYNPQKAKLVTSLVDWEFSNYLEWVGKRNGKLFNNEILKDYFRNSYNYNDMILEHEKYDSNQKFKELLIDI